jgi:glycosyltransferase involved in cell wall biosynthesis
MTMRLLFALPGFHRFDRGAEVAMLAIAEHCARAGDAVTVMGSGGQRPDTPYVFRHVPAIDRKWFERMPSVPLLRGDTAYEEASFAPGLARSFRPDAFDATITCSYPFTNWLLRRPRLGGKRPAHVFVTQNGDWPAITRTSEYRWFGCEGLVCTNPDFYERNKDRWPSALIPNGIDLERFSPGTEERARLGLPEGRPIVLMVSALIASKRVADGIRAMAAVPEAHLVVAGDGALRGEVDALAATLLPGRFTRLMITPADMPALYRSANAFLHLSLLESFGNVFVEAMACGLPIIGHDTPRLRWIVGDDDPLVDTRWIPAVSQAIAATLAVTSGRVDGYARAERFGWDQVGAAYRTFIGGLLR